MIHNQYLYSWYLSSVIVFTSWWCLQSGCQFLSSQNKIGLPRCGLMWSTTVAFTSLPSLWHWTQRGWHLRNLSLAFLHLLSYPRTAESPCSCPCSKACSSQYIPSTSFGQPGCLHGFFGFLGIAPRSFLMYRVRWKDKARTHTNVKDRKKDQTTQDSVHL